MGASGSERHAPLPGGGREPSRGGTCEQRAPQENTGIQEAQGDVAQGLEAPGAKWPLGREARGGRRVLAKLRGVLGEGGRGE